METTREYILEKLSLITLSVDVTALLDDDNIIESAVCDSTGFLELIMALEDKFDIFFDDDDFNNRFLYTLSGLELIIKKKIESKNDNS